MKNLEWPKAISIIGLGKLGSPLLAAIASRGFRVIGVDLNRKSVEKINRGVAPVFEPRLSELLKRHRAKISATTNFAEAIQNTELTFVIVPTPSDDKGAFTNAYVKAALVNIGQALIDKETYHLVAVVSTVMPQSMRTVLQPALEKSSGKNVGNKLGFCYNPAFIALGDVIKNLLEPDVVLIGESDKVAGEKLTHFYTRFCTNQPPIRRMNFVNSEISKLSLNTYITTKISYANMLAELCEKIPGADAHVVTQTVGLDSRVGKKYLTGAIAYGGPCFPRDNRALTVLGKRVGADLLLARSTDIINTRQTAKIFKLLEPKLRSTSRIGIVGIAYKPGTDVTQESQGLKLVQYFKQRKKSVLVYDPLVKKPSQNILTQKIKIVSSLKSLVDSCDAIILTTSEKKVAWDLQKRLTFTNKPLIIFDCWRILNIDKLHKKIVYLSRGQYPA